MISRIIMTACLALTGIFASACQSETATESDPVIYLVRHGEKQAGSDPQLSEAGTARSERLAEQLRDVPLQAIWSTDTLRTRETAAPTASDHGLEVALYDANDLSGFAERLKQAGETALVVGHSNTTPELAAFLGGDAGPEMDESDYERLYEVRLSDGRTRMFTAGGEDGP